MNTRIESNLKRFWFTASGVSLLLPVFLSSLNAAHGTFENVVEVAVISLFFLSFPSSFFAVPLLALFKMILEIDLGSMFGAYFYLVLLNIIGYVQWFWLMPTFLGKSKPYPMVSILKD